MSKQIFATIMTGISCLCAISANATASPLIYNQTQWQEISSDNGVNPLTTINLTTATYVNSTVPYSHGGEALAQSLNAAPFEVTFANSYIEAGSQNYPTVSGGSVTSVLADYNSLVITFGAPVYSFGAIFDIPTSTDPLGPDVVVGVTNSVVTSLVAPGFDGFVSDSPFTSLSLYDAGCSPQSPYCVNDISLSDIQVSTAVPTPEPATSVYLGTAVALALVLRRFSRYYSAKIAWPLR